MNRAGIILGHLNGVTQRTGRLLGKDGVFTSTLSVSTVPVAGSKPLRRPKPVFMENDDDVVIVSALRTPICKSKRGGFKDTLPDDLLSAAFSAVLRDTGIDPASIQDICVGNVSQPGAGANIARMAQFMRALTKAKSQEPAYSQALNQNKVDRQLSRSRESGRQSDGYGG